MDREVKFWFPADLVGIRERQIGLGSLDGWLVERLSSGYAVLRRCGGALSVVDCLPTEGAAEARVRELQVSDAEARRSGGG